jgi:L-threonylcarbamoyladenylate synthase
MPNRTTRILRLSPERPDQNLLREAAAILRAGGLVAFPTETVYGLGANALDAAAVERIFDAKGRPATNPVIVHVVGESMLGLVAARWPRQARDLATRFWPGPLTLVLPKGSGVPDIVTAGGSTVGVRIPDHPVALGLIREAGVPLAAPSANRSSQLSPTRAEHVLAGLDGRIDLILDAGPTANGIESTVLDLTRIPPVLLRPGPISIAELEAVIGSIVRRSPDSATSPLPSPGLLPRHYAPRTPVELFASRRELLVRASALRQVGMVLFGSIDGGAINAIGMPIDPPGYAAQLYAVLHDLDTQGLDHILIELPPDTEAWLAVRDRLMRAATVKMTAGISVR